MSGEESRDLNLEPARWGEDGGFEGYRRGFPWKLLLGIAVVVGSVIALHTFAGMRRVESARSELLALIDAEVVPMRKEIVGLRARVSELALERYRREELDAPFVAEGFDLESLREGQVLTLRLIRHGELGEGDVGLAVRHGAPDDIGSCLGVKNIPASVLYEGSDFLGEDFVENVQAADSELELRGIRDQLERRLYEVLPRLREGVASGRMILSIERPDEARIEVFILELETGRDLMRLLARSDVGRLISARAEFAGVRSTNAPLPEDEKPLRGAVDCGVARQIRDLLERE